jgi:hypothetical protein
MNESIYNLIPVEYVEPEKKPMYRCTKSASSKVPNSTFGCHGSTRPLGAGKMEKKDGALFGPPKAEFGLTTNTKLSQPKDEAKDTYSNSTSKYDPSARRPRVPGKEEKPIMGITTSKNYVTANAVEAILQVPKQTITPELNYMKKEDFGKTPAYLSQVKDEIRRENEMIERYVKEQMGEIERPAEVYEEMDEDDRLDLITALKAKWNSVNAAYQKITHLVLLDTTGQVRRKETFENKLASLERDIDKLERASNILVRP